MLNIDAILKEKEVTTEKNVYGFVYFLFLFAELNGIAPHEVLDLIGEKIKHFILCGWGDLCQGGERTMIEWSEELLKEGKVYHIKREAYEPISIKARAACTDIFQIKENNPDLGYTIIIREYFERKKEEFAENAISVSESGKTESIEEVCEDVIAFSVSEMREKKAYILMFYRYNGESICFAFSEEQDPLMELSEISYEYYYYAAHLYFKRSIYPEQSESIAVVNNQKWEKCRVYHKYNWWHFQVDSQNHLFVDERFYRNVSEVLDSVSKDRIIDDWVDLLNESEFPKRADEIVKFILSSKS